MRLDRRSDEDFERALLGAASSDGPAPGTKERAWARFAASWAMADRSIPPKPAETGAAKSVLRRSARGAGWLAAGLLVGSIATIGAVAMTDRTASVSLRSPPRVWVAWSASSEAPSAEAVPLASGRADAETPTSPAVSSKIVRQRSQHAVPRGDEASLAAEFAALDAARNALHRGAPEDALALLQRYRRDFPQGKLAPEAAVTVLEALAARGDHDGVTSGAATFLERYPDAPQRYRVEQLRAEAARP